MPKVYWLAEVEKAGFAPAFTFSQGSSEFNCKHLNENSFGHQNQFFKQKK